MKKILVFSVIAVILIAGAVLFAAGCNRGPMCFIRADNHEERVDCVVEHLSDELELDDSQEQLARQLSDEIIARFEDGRQERLDCVDFITEQVQSDELDLDVINEKMDEHQIQKRETRIYVLERLAAFHEVLNDDQKAIIVEKIQNMKEHMQEHFND